MEHTPATKKDIVHLHDQIDALKQYREDDLERLRQERKEDIDMIMKVLQPMSDTYKTATILGKWIMASAVFISILLGILLSIKSVFRK